jgi:deazaflavin-dependent oxidoreductase (nitroreductase family)
MTTRRRPTGLTRLFFRAPLLLYRAGLGRLMGERFLLLNHVGRKSGLQRQTVLEVVDHERASDTYFVAAGYGPGSDWYRNLRAAPEVVIQVGARRLAVTADLLDPEASGAAMVDYRRRHPAAARNLGRVLFGKPVSDTEEAFFEVGRDLIPFVAFRPRP